MAIIRREDPKKGLVLAALEAAPLDRIRLMKTLFLAWHRAGRPSDWPFQFEPYSYGPCSFAVYSTLDSLQSEGLLVQLPEGNNKGRYYLTPRGEQDAEASIGRDLNLGPIAEWAARQSFDSLLRTVYREAPDFASRSIVRKQVLGE